MLTLKNLVFHIAFLVFSFLGSLKAADSRLLVLSIQLPPQNFVNTLKNEDGMQKSTAKINNWGTLRPEKFAKKMVKGIVPLSVLPTSPSGIMGIYGGYCGYSDHSGLLTFPLRHTDSHVDVIFTPSISLQQLVQETYSGVFISQKTMTDSGIIDSMAPKRYLYTLKTTQPFSSDASSKKTDSAVAKEEWVVAKTGVSLDTRLSQSAVIILVNPANMFVQPGVFSTTSKPHLVLPDMYLIGKKFNDAVLLNNLANLKYFEEIVVADATVAGKKVEIKQAAITND